MPRRRRALTTAGRDRSQPDEKNGAAADRVDVDRAVEWDRKPRLEVEAVKVIDDVPVLAVRPLRGAVEQGQIDFQSGIVV